MTIEEVKRKYEHEWLALPGVVSVGIGRNEESKAVIKVGIVEGEYRSSTIPEHVRGFDVVLVHSGRIKADHG